MEENETGEFSLEQDESEHFERISDEVMQNIELAESAAKITINGFASIKEPVRINEARGLVLLLLAKAAKNVRFAAVGLKLGYYSGVSAVVRSALESLLYAALFDSEPRQAEEWFINEFSSKSTTEMNAFRERQMKAARQALLDLETNRLVIKDAMHEFTQKANRSVHASMEGLSDEFGISLDSLLPDDFRKEYEKAGFDFDSAIARYSFLRRYGKDMIKGPPADDDDEVMRFQTSGRYDEDIIDDLALFNFYVAHRLLDMSKSLFDIRDEDFVRDYKLWHKEIHETH